MKQSKALRQCSAMVLILCAMSGCDSNSTLVSSLFGETRTLPEGAQVDFNNRHAPVLNPSPGAINAAAIANALPDNASSPPSMTAPSTQSLPPDMPTSGRRVPAENMMAQSAMQPMTMGAPVFPIASSPMPTMSAVPPASAAATPTPAAPSADLKTPSSPLAAAPVIAAPVASPVTPAPSAAAPAPGAVKDLSTEVPGKQSNSGNAAPMALADVPPASQVSDNSAYPALANVPPTPQAPSKEQNTSQFKDLVADHDTAESGRRQLMGNADATVMTSPQTGKLVDNPSDAVPPAIAASEPPAQNTPAAAAVPAPAQQASAVPAQPSPNPANQGGGGFNAWLHHLFGGDAKTQMSAQNNAQAEPADAKMSSENPAAPGAPMATASTVAQAAPAPTASADTPFQARDMSSANLAPAVDVPTQASSGGEKMDLTVRPVPSAVAQTDAAPQVTSGDTVGKEVAPNVVLVNPQVDIVSQPITQSSAQPVAATAAAPAEAPQDAFMQPVNPVSMPTTPVTTAAPTPLISAPVASEAPVHLTPPPAAVADTTPLPDAPSASSLQDAPISLVPPPVSTAGGSVAQTQYLNDSRYAARRMQQNDNSNSN